jgi:gamma-glutamylcyclotransferase (GGCT)/AIG2-like uncharacterized protein YtfP
LFVYGSLKKGGSANHYLEGGTLIDSLAAVQGVLLPIGWFPGLVRETTCQVFGEIYRMPKSAFEALDQYEGVATGLFRRVKYDTYYDTGWMWVYEWGAPVTLSETTNVIAQGVYGLPEPGESTVKQKVTTLASLRQWFVERKNAAGAVAKLYYGGPRGAQTKLNGHTAVVLPMTARPPIQELESQLPLVVQPPYVAPLGSPKAHSAPYRWNDSLMPPQEMT